MLETRLFYVVVLFSGLEQWFTFSFCGVEGGIVHVLTVVYVFLWDFIIADLITAGARLVNICSASMLRTTSIFMKSKCRLSMPGSHGRGALGFSPLQQKFPRPRI